MPALLPADGRLLVVGAGLAALRLCQEVRRLGFVGEVVVLGREPHRPYDRPPLSKQVLLPGPGDAPGPSPAGSVSDLAADGTGLDDLGVDVRTGTRALALDPLARRVTTTTGTTGTTGTGTTGEERYDALVVASGAEPVLLPGDGPQHAVRTWEDAVALRARLVPGARVVVVGAGWIGAEVATAALAHGADVTCLEAGPAPAWAAVGEAVARRVLTPLWRDVRLRTGTRVDRVVDEGVLLADGALVPADVVVVGVGVRPTVGWLRGSGVPLGAGVLVDEHLRSGADGVLAVGDAAERWSPRWRRRLRAEHWEEASTGPAVAARVLLDGPEGTPAHDPVPYVWSDQHGARVQLVGLPAEDAGVVWREHVDGSPTATWLSRDGRLLAVLTVDRPREAAQARRAVGRAPDRATLADPATPLHRA